MEARPGKSQNEMGEYIYAQLFRQAVGALTLMSVYLGNNPRKESHTLSCGITVTLLRTPLLAYEDSKMIRKSLGSKLNYLIS